MNRPTILLVLVMTLLFFGCSKDKVLPADGKPMAQIYEEFFEGNSLPTEVDARAKLGRPIQNGEADLSGYTRDAQNEVESLFPRLPNPVLVMFIYPHLSGDGHPVPGYSTSFDMYEKEQYALPGELAMP